MPRAAKRDPLGTERRCFLDPLSFVSCDGREFLAGEDTSVRRHEVFERSGGFCEFPGCNREIDEFLPSDHPHAMHMHHVKSKGKGGSDCINNLMAGCTRCHKRFHAQTRDTRWSSKS